MLRLNKMLRPLYVDFYGCHGNHCAASHSLRAGGMSRLKKASNKQSPGDNGKLHRRSQTQGITVCLLHFMPG